MSVARVRIPRRRQRPRIDAAAEAAACGRWRATALATAGGQGRAPGLARVRAGAGPARRRRSPLDAHRAPSRRRDAVPPHPAPQRGIGSVAEAAALAAAGRGARLVVARVVSRRRHGDRRGARRGDIAMTVHFIGAGPGAPDLLTLRGRDLIAAARSVSTRARWCRDGDPGALPAGCARSSNTAPLDARRHHGRDRRRA